MRNYVGNEKKGRGRPQASVLRVQEVERRFAYLMFERKKEIVNAEKKLEHLRGGK